MLNSTLKGANTAAALSWNHLLLQLPAKALKYTRCFGGGGNQEKEQEQLAVRAQAATETLPQHKSSHVVGPRHQQPVEITKFPCCDVMSDTGNGNGGIVQASSCDCIPHKALHANVDLRKKKARAWLKTGNIRGTVSSGSNVPA